MSKQIKNAKTIQSKSRTNEVHPMDNGRYSVVSGTSGKVYSVRLNGNGGTCTCDWAKYRPAGDNRSGCSHVVAAINFAAQVEGATSVSAWTSEADAARQHRQTINIGDGVLVTVRA
jgi:uncharacterized Zn finger protein